AEADEDYIAQCNAQGLYPAAYYPHNIHFLWYSAMMEGRKTLAIDNALKLAERVPVEVARQMGALQSYLAVPVYTYVRFGMWDQVLALPAPAEGLPYTQAMHLYGNGLAHAASGDLAAADASLKQLRALGSTDALKNMTMRRPGVTQHLIGIAENLVQARIHRARAQTEQEISALRQAVTHQDALPYTEPPLWHYPVRQALGEALLRSQQYAAATNAFLQDLAHFPQNPWSLYGLELAKQGLEQNAEQIATQRRHAWRNADITPAVAW
ncbi:unnamed protein product, partial [Scytosiphon promiscuus]